MGHVGFIISKRQFDAINKAMIKNKISINKVTGEFGETGEIYDVYTFRKLGEFSGEKMNMTVSYCHNNHTYYYSFRT